MSGFNLTCVGDEDAYSYIETPYNNTISDDAIKAALIGKENVIPYTFLERGSDERQYCSPGIDLPVCTFCRSRFGKYPEYHTSADNFNVVTQKGLNDSFEVMKSIIDAFETALHPINLIKCEPQLGKRNLYPEFSDESINIKTLNIRKNILVYANSVNTIFEIANLIRVPLIDVINEVKILIKNGIMVSESI